jgi:Secretion system C-terminal sorting domain
MKHLITIAVCISLNTFSQGSINCGGNTIKGEITNIDYSIGEIINIVAANNNISIKIGTLQPFTTNFISELQDVNNLENLTVYPNPTNGFLKIDMQDFLNYELLNTSGKNIIKFASKNSIDLSDEPSGIYLLIVLTSDLKIKKTFKIIKN